MHFVFAYERCKANGGPAGVDSHPFENIAAYGGDDGWTN
jgi:hypothetical protein